jgi:hypothetical protein
MLSRRISECSDGCKIAWNLQSFGIEKAGGETGLKQNETREVKKNESKNPSLQTV